MTSLSADNYTIFFSVSAVSCLLAWFLIRTFTDYGITRVDYLMFIGYLVLMGVLWLCIHSIDANAGPALNIYVIDADTVSVQSGNNRVKHRLSNIDAPESYKPRCSAEALAADRATARLKQLISEAKPGAIVLTGSGKRDKYGRTLSRLMINGSDAGETLIKEGLALRWKPGKKAWEQRRKHWCKS